MWKRIKRAVSSNLGRFGTDPLSDVPRRADLDDLGESLEVVKTQVSLLAKDLKGLEAEEAALSSKIRQALDAGDRDGAKAHASVLARVRDSKQRVKIQLDAANSLCRRAEGVSRDLQTPELDAAADETLARIEAGLQREGKVPREAQDDSRVLARKTLGDESGPVPAGKGIAESGGPAGKSIGGEGAYEDDSGPQRTAAKTIGGGGSSGTKTIGGGESAPAVESAPSPKLSEDSGGDLVAELERLAKLLDKGILSKDEFEQAKKKLLG